MSLAEDNQITDSSNVLPPPSINTVGLRPKYIYGLRTNIVGNIHFNLQQEVVYPVEGVLAFHDFVENKQRFLRCVCMGVCMCLRIVGMPRVLSEFLLSLLLSMLLLQIARGYHTLNYPNQSTSQAVGHFGTSKKVGFF